MEELKLKNVTSTAQHVVVNLGPDAKGVTVLPREDITVTQEQFTGNVDIAGKIRLGILRPVPPVPSWAVGPVRSLGVSL